MLRGFLCSGVQVITPVVAEAPAQGHKRIDILAGVELIPRHPFAPLASAPSGYGIDEQPKAEAMQIVREETVILTADHRRVCDGASSGKQIDETLSARHNAYDVTRNGVLRSLIGNSQTPAPIH